MPALIGLIVGHAGCASSNEKGQLFCWSACKLLQVYLQCADLHSAHHDPLLDCQFQESMYAAVLAATRLLMSGIAFGCCFS